MIEKNSQSDTKPTDAPLTAERLLEELQRRGVRLIPKGTDLEIDAPRGALDNELFDQCRAQKESLLALLVKSTRAENFHPRGEPGQLSPPEIELSPAQERIMPLTVRDNGSDALNLPLAFRLTGALRENELICAIHDISEKHEILRTVFQKTGDGFRQRVLSISEFAPEILQTDVADRPELFAALRQFVERPFSVFESPPARFAVLRESGDSVCLVIVLHHLLADGWSFNILLRDLADAYSVRTGKTVSADSAGPTIQYREYASRHLDNPDPVDASDLPARLTPFPLIAPPQRAAIGPIDFVEAEISESQCLALEEFAKARSASLYCLLFASLKIILKRQGAGPRFRSVRLSPVVQTAGWRI